MPAIYCADCYCDACARAIRKGCRKAGTAPPDPSDESSYDSGEYPKYMPDDEESDGPQHCGSGPKCLEAEILSDGERIGALLSHTLTTEGVRYLREMLADCRPTLAAFWREQFADYLEPCGA